NALISLKLIIEIENTLISIRNISSVREISVKETLVRDFSETENLLINSKITDLSILKNLIYTKTFSE
ncbi:hypothetical protein EMPG_11795, partial [Blastomyces silverae]